MFHHLAQGSWYNLAKFLPKKSPPGFWGGTFPKCNLHIGIPLLKGTGIPRTHPLIPPHKKAKVPRAPCASAEYLGLDFGEMEIGVSTNSNWGGRGWGQEKFGDVFLIGRRLGFLDSGGWIGRDFFRKKTASCWEVFFMGSSTKKKGKVVGCTKAESSKTLRCINF